MALPQPPPALVAPAPATDAAIRAALDEAAQTWRIPSALLHGLAWRVSRWKAAFDDGARVGVLGVPIAGRSDVARLRSDWRYALDQGARHLYLCWNRAPILGNGVLEDGRNLLECWFFALGRYGTGKEGPEANAWANTALDALATGGDGRFAAVGVSRPSPEALAWGRGCFGPPAPWHFGDVAPRPAAFPVVDLPVPYVQQAWDSPDDFDGGGSCGPSAMVMVLAAAGKIAPKPVEISESYPHVSPWGGHIPEIDARVCEPNLGAVHAKMLDYLRPLYPDVAIFYNEKATFARVKAELDAGRPVILGTRVTPAGHLMTARGYFSDHRLIVNDPAGDQTRAARRSAPWGSFSPTGNRYWNGGGDGAVYEWDALDVRWVMTFGPRDAAADPPEDGPAER